MRKGDPLDPLFLQVWPSLRESDASPGYVVDAVGDLGKVREAGLIHKYQGRVLLVATGACAVHCRYCFRRHFPYSEQLAARDHWAAALAEIAADGSIEEVILSRSEEPTLSDYKLADLGRPLHEVQNGKPAE